ncbi:hypothetical protein [Ferribacterium limneticum]|uniref:hypothetical protein n=1 Tax=Ferribacterium limneticum TaxID=76259 RepID=UPI001CF8C6C9|nr:hypothetical protein [Ferribacterium limneticum]UCV26738.1 hypothetical protein KI617_10495 [Ferribacterium limneticum]UCV30655.1 hypothetical protein KI608_10495 [Ferribacterium limneticum]
MANGLLLDRSYVIVIHPGDHNEEVVEEGLTFRKAHHVLAKYQQGMAADIMKRLPDGSLTTVY